MLGRVADGRVLAAAALREHYRFTGDQAFWNERAWPLIDGDVAFALASLTELPAGALGLVPSTSPENSYLTDDGTRAAVTISATMDIALIRGDFMMWTSAAEVVLRQGGSVDGDRAQAVAAALPRLVTRLADRAAPPAARRGYGDDQHRDVPQPGAD